MHPTPPIRSLTTLTVALTLACQGQLESAAAGKVAPAPPHAAPPSGTAPPWETPTAPGAPGPATEPPADPAPPPAAEPSGAPPSPTPPEEDAATPDAPPSPPSAPPPPDELACGEPRPAQKVYRGTREPTFLPLLPEQQMAIGTFGGCTGTLITPNHVLSATHCGHPVGAEFCFGPEPDAPDHCLRAVAVHENPSGDMTVLELDRPATELSAAVQPIPILTETLDDDWLGRTAEAAGYGQRDDGGYGGRRFTAEPIASLDDGMLTIDGEGRRGVCFGDSGGPVMVLAGDGSVRVAGDLSYGDPSCLGQDRYTRTDLHRAWIEAITGPTPAPGGCGGADEVGRCIDNQAVYCREERRVSEPCPGACGWSVEARGFRCLAGPDPCGGVDAVGRCEGAVARYCVDGVPARRDCAACGQACGQGPAGADCLDDPCQGLDYQGECRGDLARWCEEGELRTEDCAAQGRGCGWVDDETGWFCR